MVGVSEYATVEGTRRYRDRMVTMGWAHAEHFRDELGGLALSSIGLGTYLGGHDDGTDALYLSAIKQALGSGCNVLDTAINYRCQRSERVIGSAVREAVRDGRLARDEMLVATKGGFIPHDRVPPSDNDAYLQETFVRPGIVSSNDVVADCHCMTPVYLRHQLQASLANLGLPCVDVYYLHNPETQLDYIPHADFLNRVRAAFEVLEEAVARGQMRMYGTATWDGYRAPIGARGHLSLEAMVAIAREVGGGEHHFRVIQVPYNLGMPEALAEQTQTLDGSKVSLLEAARALGLYVMASASLLQGQLSEELPSDVRDVLGEGTDAQRSIQFVRSTPGLGTALVGMKQPDHVRDNLALAGRAPLAPDDFAKLFK